MATTIPTAFSQLQRNLEITAPQKETVSMRQQNVRVAVESELIVLRTFLTGSYMRSTMIVPLSNADIDIFVVLDSKYYYESSQAGLLDRVKRVLVKAHPNTEEISRNGQAVTITFNDFAVDVVPAFNRQGGGYIIPNSNTKTWIETDPEKHIQIWSDANKAHAGDLVPLIKMLKCWNREHSKLLRSFYLETLILKVFTNVTINSYSSGARFFFDKARNWIGSALLDPAGYSDVSAYLDTEEKKKAVLDRLNFAYAKALEAEQLVVSDRISEAIGKWRIIFGDKFPAYG